MAKLTNEDRRILSTMLAKATAWHDCGKSDDASKMAWSLVQKLEALGILRERSETGAE